jgi:hypothetical protein
MQPMSEDEILSKIDQVMRKHAVEARPAPMTPLEALMAAEEGDEAEEAEADRRMALRVQTFRRLLDFFFECGPDPLQVLRRIYAVAKALRPELIGDMAMEDIAIICGDGGGRSTVSARIKRVYGGTITKAGGRPVAAPCEKRGNFSTPQLANQNSKKTKQRHP